jgi:hypothetical protein
LLIANAAILFLPCDGADVVHVVSLLLMLVGVYASWCMLKKGPIWTETLKHQTGFNEP